MSSVPYQGFLRGPSGEGKDHNKSTIALYVTAKYQGDSANRQFSLRHVFSHPSPETEQSRQLEAQWRSLVDSGADSYKWKSFFELTLCHVEGEVSVAGLQKARKERLSKEMTKQLRASLLSCVIIHFSFEGTGYAYGEVPGLQVLGYEQADFDRIRVAGSAGTFNYTQGVRPIHPDRGLTIAFHDSVSENMARKIAASELGVGPQAPLQPAQPASEALQRFLHELPTDPSQYAEARSQTLMQQMGRFNSSWPEGGTQRRVLPTLTADPEYMETSAGSQHQDNTRMLDLPVSYSQTPVSYSDPSWSATVNNPQNLSQADRLPELRSTTAHRRRRQGGDDTPSGVCIVTRDPSDRFDLFRVHSSQDAFPSRSSLSRRVSPPHLAGLDPCADKKSIRASARITPR